MLNTRKCSFFHLFRSSGLELQQCGLALALAGDEVREIVLVATQLDLPPPPSLRPPLSPQLDLPSGLKRLKGQRRAGHKPELSSCGIV